MLLQSAQTHLQIQIKRKNSFWLTWRAIFQKIAKFGLMDVINAKSLTPQLDRCLAARKIAQHLVMDTVWNMKFQRTASLGTMVATIVVLTRENLPCAL